ncbi:MAG: ribosome maturation factor RimM [Oscillospiraceae bacterium]|jgi:16S rRNA processing protein RimM|nr:ribosome maturation factor RimM [Oscillospiraceae bacterium]
MKKEFLEAGRIVGTHGVRGEVRVDPWCDEPEFLLDIPVWYIDGRAVSVQGARVHKRLVLAKLEGVDDINAAQCMRGMMIALRRADAPLPEGRFFVQDILGFAVVDDATGAPVGRLKDVWRQPAQEVYVVEGPEGEERLIPNVPVFVKGVDTEGECIRVALIEGM